jgi:hypothetical protein
MNSITLSHTSGMFFLQTPARLARSLVKIAALNYALVSTSTAAQKTSKSIPGILNTFYNSPSTELFPGKINEFRHSRYY